MAEDKVSEWDKLLAYNVYPMTFAYFHRFLLANYIEFLENFKGESQTKDIFKQIGLIFAQKIIIENGEFYRDYLTKEQLDGLKDSIMDNLLEMRKEVIALTYLLPFTDKMYGAVGRSEMKPYEYFLDAVDNHEKSQNSHIDDDIILSDST